MGIAISVRLPDGLVAKLDAVAEDIERPRTFLIQKALEAYMDDYADLQIALDRLRDKEDEPVTGSELKKSLGL